MERAAAAGTGDHMSCARGGAYDKVARQTRLIHHVEHFGSRDLGDRRLSRDLAGLLDHATGREHR
jgi:hypothetical protein